MSSPLSRPRCVGIDVGAKYLDCAATEGTATAPQPALPRRVPNTAAGITTLIAALAAAPPALVVLEATGTYHRPLVAALLAAAVPVTVVNPAAVAAFRQRRLGRHKTDRADAALLARFGELHHDELRQAVPEAPDLAELRALVGYRDDLIARQTRLRNQRHAAEWAGSTTVVAWLSADLAELTARCQEVGQAIAALLATRPEAAVLTAQIGVGPLVAAAVLAYLPAGVWGEAKAAAAYAGLHPRQEQSGQRDHSRLSKQGCAALRRYLYLAALVAVRFDPELAAWYQRLQDRGKPAKSALCAVAHKLLRRLMGRLRAWRQATLPQTA